MQIKKYALSALACAAVLSQGSFSQKAVAADSRSDDANRAGSFYFRLRSGYNNAATRKMSYSDVPSTVQYIATLGDVSAGTQLRTTDNSTLLIEFLKADGAAIPCEQYTLDGTTKLATHDKKEVILKLPKSAAIYGEEIDGFSGTAISTSLGYKISDSVRAEISYTYAGGKAKHRDKNSIITELESQSHEFMLSSYYDVKMNGDITPFIGAGVGYSVGRTLLASFDNTSIGGSIRSIDEESKFKTENGLTGKVEAGLQFEVYRGVNIEGSYSLKATATSNDSDDKKLQSTPKFLDQDGSVVDASKATFSRGASSALSQMVTAGVSISF